MKRRNYSNSFPSAIRSKPVITRVFRFGAGALLTAQAVQTNDLLRLLSFGTPTGAVTMNCLIDNIKLDKVSIWGAGSTSMSSVNLTWAPGPLGLGREVEVIAYGTNVSLPHIDSVPPPNSTAAMWISTSTTNATLFTVTCAQNSVVDLHVSMILSDASTDGATNSFTTGGAGSVSVTGVYSLAIGGATGLVPGYLAYVFA